MGEQPKKVGRSKFFYAGLVVIALIVVLFVIGALANILTPSSVTVITTTSTATTSETTSYTTVTETTTGPSPSASVSTSTATTSTSHTTPSTTATTAVTKIRVEGFNRVNETYILKVYDGSKQIITVKVDSPSNFTSGYLATYVHILVNASEGITYDYISLAFSGVNSPIEAGSSTLKTVPEYAEVLVSSTYDSETLKGRMFVVNMKPQPFYETREGEKFFVMSGLFLIKPQQEKSSIQIGFSFGLFKDNSEVNEARLFEVPLASITTTSK